jgi:hypothetical protein
MSLEYIINSVGSHSNRLDQLEDRISGHKDKINVKEKNR